MAYSNSSSLKIESSTEHKTLKENGYDIHYFVSGKNTSDSIVFLHPAFSDHRAFDQQIGYFLTDHKVITIDLIGHGLSRANRSKDKIDASSEHICKILELEGIDTVNLVGVSMGSLIAQYFGLQYPDKVKSLTVLGGYDISKDDKEVKRAQMASNLGLIIRAVFSMKSFRRKIAETTCITKEGKALFYDTAGLYKRKSFLVMQGLKNVIKENRNFKPKYQTFILTGEFDIELAKKMAKQWHASLENSEYFMIKDAGHCANMDKPLEFNKLVKKFIKRQK